MVENLFPHTSVRETQDELIKLVSDSIRKKQHLIVHAPTGLGKTAATLSPALSYALANKKVVFFLTSRHTQHMIVVNTLKQIKKKHGVDFSVADIIGKKHLCCQDNVESLYSNEFNEYCKNLRENKKCEYYNNTKDKSGKVLPLATSVVSELSLVPSHAEDTLDESKRKKLCGYEIAALLAKKAQVVVSDYSYIFNPSIRDSFFTRTGINLEDCIVIVDEGHNLPKRCREQLTFRLSSFVLDRAVKEAEKFEYDVVAKLSLIKQVIGKLGDSLDERNDEIKITKGDLVNSIKISYDYDDLINEFELIGDFIRGKQKSSFIGSVGSFLEEWQGQDESFARILKKTYGKYINFVLSYRCLDPSLVTKEVVDNCHNLIMMSGTLNPTYMYKDLMGISDCVEKEFISPFPNSNRLNLIVPETSSKYTSRNDRTYTSIASICARLVNAIKGNCAIFFPSYYFRDQVNRFFDPLCKKTIFSENPRLTKSEKEDLLERFKGYKDSGAVLLGVASGNFGEGVDLPGDYLNGVVVVGIPLQKPDVETKELINYYDRKYGKGWDYGYILPALTSVLQNAGRCIRSETDKGIIAFVDERFVQEKYLRCFPVDWDIRVKKDFESVVREFYS